MTSLGEEGSTPAGLKAKELYYEILNGKGTTKEVLTGTPIHLFFSARYRRKFSIWYFQVDEPPEARSLMRGLSSDSGTLQRWNSSLPEDVEGVKHQVKQHPPSSKWQCHRQGLQQVGLAPSDSTIEAYGEADNEEAEKKHAKKLNKRRAKELRKQQKKVDDQVFLLYPPW
eukprot:2413552-Amphidinium_carterae.2